jgi:hypothetical protein
MNKIVLIDDVITARSTDDKKLIVLIDDVITARSTDGKKLNTILGKDYEVAFIKTKIGIENLIRNIPPNLELVLLDLDLSKIKVKAEDALKNLVSKRIKVIILTVIPVFRGGEGEAQEKGWSEFAYSQKLLYGGASAYLSKTALDGQPGIFKNCIDSIINDVHKKCRLLIDCKSPSLNIVDVNGNDIVNKKFKVSDGWKTDSAPQTCDDAFLRILYEMGKNDIKSMIMPDQYHGKLKTKKFGFGDYLNSVNNNIKRESKGLFPIRLLERSRKGRGSGINSVNIGSIELINEEEKEATQSWKETIEERLTKIEKCLEQLLQQSRNK